MKPMLEIIVEEKHHDFEGLAKKIDSAIYAYLKTAFDLIVDEKKIESFSTTLSLLFQDRELAGFVFISHPNPD